MSTTTIKVTLDQTTNPWTLDVSAPQVSVDAFPMTIDWQLDGTPAGSEWSTDQGYPAFKWLENNNKPPPGTFSNPGINGVDLTAQDNGPAGGPWPYQLCIKLNNQYYYTSNALGPVGKEGKAPTVKNN